MINISRKRNCCFLAISLFMLAWTQGVFAAKESGGPSATSAPFIYMPHYSYDFGEVMEGAEVQHDFVMGNTGSGFLNIDRVKTD